MGILSSERCSDVPCKADQLLSQLAHVQVIFCVWCILPPSAWFSPSHPLPFLAVTCAVLLLSSAAAWLHSRFWAWAIQWLGSSSAGAAAAGASPKVSQAHAVHVDARDGKASPAA
jgi:hypothetical protein